MNRKEFLAVVISAALGLSGAPVYASESAAFSDGEVQEYGAEEEKQEFQTDSQDPETDTFQDEVESDADTDGFVDEATGVSSGEADANGFTYQYLKESDTYRLTKGTDTENVIIPYEYNGKVVSEVGERAFYGCINIKTVKAEEGADRRKNRGFLDSLVIFLYFFGRDVLGRAFIGVVSILGYIQGNDKIRTFVDFAFYPDFPFVHVYERTRKR